MKSGNIMYMVFIYMLFISCKKPYAPSIVSADNHFLVVEGVINSSLDSTVIILSRTIKISGRNSANPETRSQVSIENDQHTDYPLKETKPGRYVSAPLNLDPSHKYNLKITTADGRMYQSDFEKIQSTPPIDTLYYTTGPSGLSIYSATHDPSNGTRYYRWEYFETYVYISGLNSYFKFDNSYHFNTQKSVYRDSNEWVNVCYNTDTSSNILLNSSAKLSSDVITENPITQLSSSSEKIYHRYSILVKQYALTKEAYQFWSLMKTNTEKLGGIFDAQPTQVVGNIHCISNPSEPVIGYISVSTVSQKRIFIDRTELPVWPYAPSNCQAFYLTWYKHGSVPSDLLYFIDIPMELVTSFYDKQKKDTGYTVKVGSYDCVDCRYHGGTTIKPPFWK